MRKKDYELIAKAVTKLDKGIRLYVGDMLAHELAQQDPKFNRGKFLKACGLEA
jgi:hypothetical protein